MKSAYELAMEKLRTKDAERGESQERLTNRQREEIAELRQRYKARQAEGEILHTGDLQKARAKGDPEALRALEAGFRRERSRLEDELESKISAVKRKSGR